MYPESMTSEERKRLYEPVQNLPAGRLTRQVNECLKWKLL